MYIERERDRERDIEREIYTRIYVVVCVLCVICLCCPETVQAAANVLPRVVELSYPFSLTRFRGHWEINQVRNRARRLSCCFISTLRQGSATTTASSPFEISMARLTSIIIRRYDVFAISSGSLFSRRPLKFVKNKPSLKACSRIIWRSNKLLFFSESGKGAHGAVSTLWNIYRGEK